jgi:hypothetical protein
MNCGAGRDISSAALAGYAKASGQDIYILRHHTFTVFKDATPISHAFAVVVFPTRVYIVDTTFAQFLKPGLLLPSGAPVLRKFSATVLRGDPQAVKMMNDLVEHGFIELTEENARLYALGLGLDPAKAALLSKRFTGPSHAVYTETAGKGAIRILPGTTPEPIVTRSELIAEYANVIEQLQRAGDPLKLVPVLEELLKKLGP